MVGGWSEIKYSVCPHPLKRPTEARIENGKGWVREGKGWVRDR